ncbi:tRNA-dihydrouridine(47) synthase [NAD(P)(+)]-like protein [Allomyces javanicus]|nr:tRNA-dihydrouridine(47) synthase [NAD(P)(+)]-like protein [Allomyces javanicus]
MTTPNEAPAPTRSSGVAPVKKEFLLPIPHAAPAPAPVPVPVAEPANDAEPENDRKRPADDASEPRAKAMRSKKDKKKFTGQNKDRPRGHVVEAVQICSFVAIGEECTRPNCRFEHDPHVFLAARDPDLDGPCPSYEASGKCPLGIRCRFHKKHTAEDGYTQLTDAARMAAAKPVLNVLTRDRQQDLRKKQFKFTRTKEYLKFLGEEGKARAAAAEAARVAKEAAAAAAAASAAEAEAEAEVGSDAEMADSNPAPLPVEKPAPLPVEKPQPTDNVVATLKLTRREKTRIDFRGKTYLAPLTTVGNLPFRRLCKGYGVDITCGEMAHTHSLTAGAFSEWALLKRHPCEDLFGVQLAGGKPGMVLEACEIINADCTVDFVDFNMGCPIDSVYGNGCGSALLDRTGRLRDILRGMDQVMDCPITAKIRTGVEKHKNVAHNLIPQFREWGVALTTLHGRSRQQRYKALADWDYINQCASAELKGGMPVFGNGDILSHEEYYSKLATYNNVDGIMIGRGALMKPWIFQEIKERRVWDISSSERLDMLRQFTSYGLEHWGSDTQGVNNTRRFLLELLSFTHRYIPVGLLEVLPQKMNERPPRFVGRNDLETLMASDNCNDWIKISEMLLGPAPAEFKFLPKHKANSYEDPVRAEALAAYAPTSSLAPSVAQLATETA